MEPLLQNQTYHAGVYGYVYLHVGLGIYLGNAVDTSRTLTSRYQSAPKRSTTI